MQQKLVICLLDTNRPVQYHIWSENAAGTFTELTVRFEAYGQTNMQLSWLESNISNIFDLKKFLLDDIWIWNLYFILTSLLNRGFILTSLR